MSPRIAAVVPAAGRSRRMGREKIELPWDVSTILETVLDKLAAIGAAPIVVVLRSDLSAAAQRALRRGARVVINPNPDEDMLTSIRLGVAALSESVDGVLVWPADHPAVSVATLETLCAGAGRSRAVLPRYRGRRGHPVVLGADLLPAVAAIAPGEGLRRLWRLQPDLVLDLEVDDPGVLVDLDTPEDYDRHR